MYNDRSKLRHCQIEKFLEQCNGITLSSIHSQQTMSLQMNAKCSSIEVKSGEHFPLLAQYWFWNARQKLSKEFISIVGGSYIHKSKL